MDCLEQAKRDSKGYIVVSSGVLERYPSLILHLKTVEVSFTLDFVMHQEVEDLIKEKRYEDVVLYFIRNRFIYYVRNELIKITNIFTDVEVGIIYHYPKLEEGNYIEIDDISCLYYQELILNRLSDLSNSKNVFIKCELEFYVSKINKRLLEKEKEWLENYLYNE